MYTLAAKDGPEGKNTRAGPAKGCLVGGWLALSQMGSAQVRPKGRGPRLPMWGLGGT